MGIKACLGTTGTKSRGLRNVIASFLILDGIRNRLTKQSPIKPLIPEAYVVNYADDLDSKMSAIAETYNNLNDGEYSQDLMTIGGRLMKL